MTSTFNCRIEKWRTSQGHRHLRIKHCKSGNISETVQDTDVVTTYRVINRKWYMTYRIAPFSMTFKVSYLLQALLDAIFVQLCSTWYFKWPIASRSPSTIAELLVFKNAVKVTCRNLVLMRITTDTRSTGTLHTSAKARLNSVEIRIRESGSPPKFSHSFTDPLPTFTEHFIQIRSEVFTQSCQQTDRQTTTITCAPWRS